MKRTATYTNWSKQAYIWYYDWWLYTVYAFLNDWETASIKYCWKKFKTIAWAERCMRKFLNS